MKKLVLSCSILATLASGAVLAGGPDIMPPLPPMVSCFDGFNVGIEGAYLRSDFNAFNAGQISCFGENCKIAQTDLFIGDREEKSGTNTVFRDFFLDIPETDFTFTSVFADNGYGNDSIGAVGLQATFGHVFHGQFSNNFYLGVTGFIDFADASDDITSSSLNVPGLIKFSTFGTPISGTEPNFTDLAALGDAVEVPVQILSISGSTFLDSHVEMDDVYGVAAKFGYVFYPNVLAYAKAGGAWSKIEADTLFATTLLLPQGINDLEKPTNILFQSETNVRETKVGFLGGIGVEYCLNNHVTINAEYNFMDFGSISSDPGPLSFIGSYNHINSGCASGHSCKLPPTAVACDTPANKHNPHCMPGGGGGGPLPGSGVVASGLEDAAQQILDATAMQATAAKTDLFVNSIKVGINYYFDFNL